MPIVTERSREFRADINGLRAWAVVLVILFHFGVPGLSGGFVGVDVFFVISGFLMTGIIIKRLLNDSGRFHTNHTQHAVGLFLIEFWLARARRIVPALLVLCVLLIALGWFWLPPFEYKVLATHASSALSFTSNIKFWREAGYFDAASHEKWLLHTWSLSVEWQFYIFLPIALLLFWRLIPRLRALTWFMAFGALASFALCVFGTWQRPVAAFYLLPTRAWEMLAGGLVFLLADRLSLDARPRRLLEGLGLALIVVSSVLFDETTQWPGWRAAVPVGGAVLVLTAARSGSMWTGSWLTQRIGDCSYSLYLWHWPVSVLLVYLGQHGRLQPMLLGLLVTAVLGWTSYKLVENPARKSLGRWALWPATGAHLLVLGLVGGVSIAVWAKAGVPGRFSEADERVAAAALDHNPRADECEVNNMPPKECRYGGQKLGVIVLGDSHAAAVVRSVEKALPSNDWHVLDWTIDSCPTIDGVKDSQYVDNGVCGKFVHKAIDRLKSDFPRVPLFIVNRMNPIFEGEPESESLVYSKPVMYLDGLPDTFTETFRSQMRNAAVKTLCKFAESRSVYVLRETPELPQNVPTAMWRAARFHGKSMHVTLPLAEHLERSKWAYQVQDMAAAQCGVKILDATPYLCDDKLCHGDKDGIPSYFDDDHLSEHGAQILIPLFRQMFAAGR